MGKYEILEKDIYSVFGKPEWQSEGIKTLPSNFLEMNAGTEFIRISIIPSGPGVNIRSVSGVVIIDIFVPASVGLKRANIIADTLDEYLIGKFLSVDPGSNTQFFMSALLHKGPDRDNASLHRSSYTIPFNYFGVSE
jgi:hypothetical protein